MVNRIVLNTVSYHGSGAVKEIGPELSARGFRKALICSGKHVVKSGEINKILDPLKEAGIDAALFTDIKANPTIENVQAGVTAFKASDADCIVAVGGGSAMDAAKGIGIIATNPEFADVVSLEGVAPTTKHCRVYHCRTHYRWHRGRSHHQLRDYRHGKGTQIRLRRRERHS